MTPDVALKTLRDQRRSLLLWTLGLVALMAMYVGIYPSMHHNSAYSDVINQMPKSVRALFIGSAGGDVTSGPGYLYVELLSFMAPMLVLLYAIGAGAGAIAGEEERHTLDLLLACPVRRPRVVVEKFLALSAGVVLLTGTLGVATIALGAAAGMQLSSGNVVATMVHLALLGLVFGSAATLVSAASGHLALARGAPALLAVAAYLVNGFAPTVGWLRPIRPASPFYQYLGHDPIRHGLAWSGVAVAAATVAVFVAVAAWAFRRRDVR